MYSPLASSKGNPLGPPVCDTDSCDTPAAAKSKARVGNPQDPSPETIVRLPPDLALATTSINLVATTDGRREIYNPIGV